MKEKRTKNYKVYKNESDRKERERERTQFGAVLNKRAKIQSEQAKDQTNMQATTLVTICTLKFIVEWIGKAPTIYWSKQIVKGAMQYWVA